MACPGPGEAQGARGRLSHLLRTPAYAPLFSLWCYEPVLRTHLMEEDSVSITLRGFL